MTARRLVLTTVASLCALTGAGALDSMPVQAFTTHHYLPTVSAKLSKGIPAEGPHGEQVPLAGPLVLAPSSMTVDSGNLWIAERDGSQGRRVDEFDVSTGAFSSQLNYSESAVYGDYGIAVGHAAGEVEVYLGEEAAAAEVAVFDATGKPQASWTGADTPVGSFGGGVTDVAADNSSSLSDWAAGDVYVAVPSQRVVDVFHPEGGGKEKYVTQITGISPSEPFAFPYKLAVDQANGDVVVLDGGSVLDIFEPTLLGEYALARQITGTPHGPFSETYNLAVDGTDGEIYLTEGFGPVVVDQFSAAGAYLGQITGVDTPAGGISDVYSLAVDPVSHDLYVADTGQGGQTPRPPVIDVFGPDVVIPDVTTAVATNVQVHGATLTGTVNPDEVGPVTCEFGWGTSEAFGKTVPCAQQITDGGAATPVSAQLSGLEPDTTYHYRLQATNSNGTNPGESGQNREFTTPGPGIHGESAVNVAATSATLRATIDPHDAPTSYYFQYGTTVSYEDVAPAPPGASLGLGEGDVEVGGQHLQGLVADTVYHYRVVAISELEPGVLATFDGPDQTFVTQPLGHGFALPDGRQWELVSPLEKHGANINQIGEAGLAQASVNGDALTYLTSSPTEAEPQGYANAAVQVLSRRGSDGWTSQDLSLPHSEATGISIGNGFEYRFFSEDLSSALVQPFGSFQPQLSPEASEQTPFLRTSYLSGDVEQPCVAPTMHCYRPLVSGAPGYANVPPGTRFGDQHLNFNGEEAGCSAGTLLCGPLFVDATPDLSHVLLSSGVPLTPGGEAALYEWANGSLTPVPGIGEAGTAAAELVGARNGISVDGSRVISRGGGGMPLVMRDIAKGRTVQLDAAQGGAEGGDGEFQIASADASRVFFTDPLALTANAKPNGPDLYECEMIEVAGELQCKLSDLTPASFGEAADVQGGVLGASEDGSYIYFVANGALAQGAVAGTCEPVGEHGTCNLYVRHDGSTKLIAVLSGRDRPDWAAVLGKQTAKVSPDGRWLAFMSQRDLTGYDTSDALSGEPDEEVYLYDASSGKLVCASCDPTGARPLGVDGALALVGGDRVWDESTRLAANIPGWTPYEIDRSLYQSRFLSDSGRLFFNSIDALVPQDVNGAEDVYEYEPPGVGNCEVSSVTFSERSEGCVDLISSGTSPEESAFLDASGSGGDVFFLTAAKLAPQDHDTALDVYDAHECRASSACFPVVPSAPPTCTTGDACKPAPTPQPTAYGAPASATFSGAGNLAPPASKPAVKPRSSKRGQKLARALKACQRKRGKHRATCRRQAEARYASRRFSAAPTTRRGGR